MADRHNHRHTAVLPSDLESLFLGLEQIDEFDYHPPKGDAQQTVHPAGAGTALGEAYARVRVVPTVGADGVTRYIVPIPSTQIGTRRAEPRPMTCTLAGQRS
jgi:hypothetical protein